MAAYGLADRLGVPIRTILEMTEAEFAGHLAYYAMTTRRR